jgi:hypothetical protein
MSNTTANVPAHIAARIAARQQAGQKPSIIGNIIKGDGFAYPKISIRAARYRLVEDGVETPVGTTLDVIIVGSNPGISKVFYAKAFDGSDGVRPDCFSNDGQKPDASVESPVSASCLTCPHNELGSKMLPSGAKSKMCADQRHLAVVPAADPTKAYALTVPVSGMKALREYFKELQNWGLDAHEVVTELGFDDKANFPKITFTRKGYPNEKVLPRIDALVASDEVKVAIRTLAPQSAGPALAAPAAPAAALAAPASVADPEEAEAEPVVVSPSPKKSKEVAPAAQDFSELEKNIDDLFSDD